MKDDEDKMIESTTETVVDEAMPDSAICLPDHDVWVAEMAYYKAEKRGFEPGHELEDWLEAEQEYLLLN